ncbi:MAG TPA: hypothetical protein VHC71_14025 [Hyphomicrobium sp.]|jgi:hypothetical protein|nr:hypothetical protein [Hyphomicrobium sp.]
MKTVPCGGQLGAKPTAVHSDQAHGLGQIAPGRYPAAHLNFRAETLCEIVARYPFVRAGFLDQHQ